MYCKHCGKQIDEQAKFCQYCGKSVNKNTSTNKTLIAKVFTVALSILSFYGIFADSVTISAEGELSPFGFVVLVLLAVCAIVIYKTRVYFISIICFVALSIIYSVRLINLQQVLMKEFGGLIDFDSFKTLYWTYLIVLSVFSIILVIKYLRDYKSEMILSIINRLKDNKPITSDDMNNIAASGIHERRKGFSLIIGIVGCIIYIFSIIFLPYPLDIGRILSILSFSCIGLFLYALYSNIKNRKPVMQLNQCFNIALCAFIIQLCSSIMSRGSGSISKLITLVIFDIGLCFGFYKIHSGFKGKLGSVHLKIYIVFSMICLCTSLALGIFYNCTSFSNFGIPLSSLADYYFRFVLLPATTSIIVNIVLLLLLNAMLRNLKVLVIRKQTDKKSLEVPIVM